MQSLSDIKEYLKLGVISTYDNWANGSQLIVKVSGLRYAAGLERYLFKNHRLLKNNTKSSPSSPKEPVREGRLLLMACEVIPMIPSLKPVLKAVLDELV